LWGNGEPEKSAFSGIPIDKTGLASLYFDKETGYFPGFTTDVFDNPVIVC
jgi:hypothetical protein